MDFGEAVKALKDGKRVTRSGWNGKGMYLELQVPDQYSKMTLPYIYMKTADDNLVPWLASQTDILEEDWHLEGEEEEDKKIDVPDTHCSHCHQKLRVTCKGYSTNGDLAYFVVCCGCGRRGKSASTPEGAVDRWIEEGLFMPYEIYD